MCAASLWVKVLMDIKDEISVTSIQVHYRAECRSRSCWNERSYSCVVGAGKQNHLRCSACVANRCNRPLYCGSPSVDIKVVRLWICPRLAPLDMIWLLEILTSFITPKITFDCDAYFVALKIISRYISIHLGINMTSLTADTTRSPSGHWWRHHLTDQRSVRSSEHSCEHQQHNMHLLPSNPEQVDRTRQSCWNPKCRPEHCSQDIASKLASEIRWAHRHEQNAASALDRLHVLGRAKVHRLQS